LTTAIDYCQRAIKKDPNYALAHAGLGRSYLLLGTLHRGPRETYPEARKHLTRALEIDETLPEGHTGLGVIYEFRDGDWPAAEREFKQAMTSDSSVGIARRQYVLYLAA